MPEPTIAFCAPRDAADRVLWALRYSRRRENVWEWNLGTGMLTYHRNVGRLVRKERKQSRIPSLWDREIRKKCGKKAECKQK